MSNRQPSDVLSTMNRLKTEFLKRFSFVTDIKQLPKREGIQANFTLIELNGDPDRVFQLLEFLIDQPYVDIYKKNGTLFVDDKINWDFYFCSTSGVINVHDWKGYSSKIASFDGCSDVQQDAEILRSIIEEGTKIYSDYVKVVSKQSLESAPLDNFLYAMGSLFLLYNHSRKLNRDDRSSFLESLMLLVSIIDTQLRYLILLTRINNRKTKKVDPDFPPLFRQQSDEIFISEREVIRLAKGEVDFSNTDKAQLFKRIDKLYNFRNRSVHRFAITSFQYSDIKAIVAEHEDIPHILGDIIERLEQEQAKLGVGFIDKGHITTLSDKKLEEMTNYLTKVKIDPEYGETPRRISMFSDKYEGGINPVLKDLLDGEFNKRTKK